MKKMLQVICLVLLVSLNAACGGMSNPTSHSTPPAALPSTPTSQLIRSPLIGSYATKITVQDLSQHPDLMQQQGPGGMDLLGTWILTFKSNGNWMALNGDYISGRQYIGSGLYDVTHDQLAVKTDSKCLEFYGLISSPDVQKSIYLWTLHGMTLMLKAIDDLCPVRKFIFATHPWIHIT